nr:MAG TPA: hypothetical protein [Caudoviricetes sp.]
MRKAVTTRRGGLSFFSSSFPKIFPTMPASGRA